MKPTLYNTLFNKDQKIFALLVDPEKQPVDLLKRTLEMAERSQVDVILVGGSLTPYPIDETVRFVKQTTQIPVLLFPGNLLQLSASADGILLLSLLSGRNAEYLIGNHVLASQFLKNSGLEIIPTGYILIDGHNLTSVEYISNTRPIPARKPDIIMATALAGEQLGMKMIYLEAGSGAQDIISHEIVTLVRNNITIPMLVGGGISTPEEVRRLYHAGANGVVVGTAIEKDYTILQSLAAVKKEFYGNK
jgi:phosphoglycerol geranylgeranyltransferase